MTTIVTSGSVIAYAVPDTSTVNLSSGLVQNADGSSFYMGDIINGSLPSAQVHSGVTLPDTSPGARPYLVWTGTNAIEGPGYAAYQAVLAVKAAAVALVTYTNLISGGLAVTSTGTPSLNGTYAVDPLTQGKIASVVAYIGVNSKFPASQTAMPMLLVSGSKISVGTTAEYLVIASAIADFVTLCDLALDTGSSFPTPSVTIA